MAGILADPDQRAAPRRRPRRRSPPTATTPASTSTTSSSRSPTAATRGRRRGRTGWRSSRSWRGRLHADGRTLTVSIPPVYDAGQTDDSGYWVYDYAAITPLVDTIRVMAYDYSVPSGEPGPIAPLPWVDGVIAGTSAASGDPSKLVLGIPLYGYNWVVAHDRARARPSAEGNISLSTARHGRPRRTTRRDAARSTRRRTR